MMDAMISAYYAAHPPTNGIDGKSVDLRISGGFIQYMQTGGPWVNLIAVSSLVGPQGIQGNAGASIELQKTATAIQWRQVGGTFADLVLLSAITGPQGIQGIQGSQGVAGNTGPSPLVSLGTATLAETAIIAITAGFRTLTITGITGLLTMDNVLLFPVVTAGVGIPDGYAIHNAWCSATGTLKVRLSVPLIALGQNYSIPCRVIVLR